ncbi:Putative serine esterase family protein [Zea mays]|uniref:Putative serine esterase family protein n=1 Tax=Zea mays TaxID=4577 RepID=A0A1D6MZN0_MAIZE|nr:Putative serine esterase family protein [Zea mays]
MRCLVGGGVQDSPRAAAKRVSPASWRLDTAAAEAETGAGGAAAKGPRVCFRPPDVMETVHEVAIYIHRFHNLDLFQQGWYQMKISALWEEGGNRTPASPARVVQYEASDVGGDDALGIWKIDDIDNSFHTQPFRIKYARQDIYLSVMVSFNIFNSEEEGPAASDVMMKFELIYAPTLDNGSELHASSATSSAAVHEFRIPHRALLGLHSYCPVHFDAFHSVLVDLTLHIVYLKAGAAKSSLKVPEQGLRPTSYHIVKALLTSRKMLLEELNKISGAIGKTVEDLDVADLNLGKYESFNPSKSWLPNSSKVFPETGKGVGQLAGILHDFLERPNDMVNGTDDSLLYTLPHEELFELFLTLSGQLSLLWNAFLKFHRQVLNKTKILDYLHDAWAIGRKAEWSIWTIHSKIEIPHRYLQSMSDDSPHRYSLRVSGSRKFHDDHVQSSASRAELHRKSIAQMKINPHYVQDMHIYGDPSRVPVVLIEQHVMVVPQHSSSKDMASNVSEQKDTIVVPKLQGEPLGHHLDLRLVRNQWLLLDPGADCLMSEANEDKTSGDFKEMGSRLAGEVVAFLKKKMDKLSRYGGCKELKLSFVGHSIGNVIIRSALAEPALQPYLKNLYTYMSISGPHLGYWYSSNSLFNSGLWLLKKLKGAQCIHQLTFSDDQDPQNTYFYKLCKLKTLENFQNIILLSSPQDGYVPYHSARIELCPAASSDTSKKGQVFTEMLNNCLDQIRTPSSDTRTFMRCDVNFDQSNQGRSLNTMIGRAAHIEFLETDLYAKFIMWSFPDLFR